MVDIVFLALAGSAILYGMYCHIRLSMNLPLPVRHAPRR